MLWTYILKCSDGSYYVGSCRNLDYRMWQHSTGKGAKYTSTRLPLELAFAKESAMSVTRMHWRSRCRVGHERNERH
jgi:predicted GIY-YIG superfamily endonuclease